MLNDRGRSSRTWDYPLTRELDQGSRGPSAPPLSSLWSLLPSSPPEAAPRVQPWDAYAVLRLSELGTWLSPVKPSCICDGNQLRPLYKLLRFLQVGAESHSSCTTPHLPPTRLVRKFPCLLDLPPINLEGSASFFSLSWSFVDRGNSDYTLEALKGVTNQQLYTSFASHI